MGVQYTIANTTATSTSAPVKQPTGTALRTMLQIATPSTAPSLKVKGWGCSFDASAAATPGIVEFFGCTGAATMSTASVAADIQAKDGLNTVASQNVWIGSTARTGFATAAVTEGTVANYRQFDYQLIAPTGQYVFYWALGDEPQLGASQFMRIRVTFGTTVNMACWVVVEE